MSKEEYQNNKKNNIDNNYRIHLNNQEPMKEYVKEKVEEL